jgi:muramoyltetrapeptide carboxypeptidase
MTIRKPNRLSAGDCIGVISPASPPHGEKKEQYGRGLQYLLDRGYRVKEGRHVFKEYGYLAGTDEERIDDLNAMVSDPHVNAIICSRGGYGTPRLLDKIDYAAVKKHPKILVGYSDITCLQLALYAKTGLVSFSGPMVAVEMGKGIQPLTEETFWPLLTSTRRLSMKAHVEGMAPTVYRRGSAEGRLLGGCLSLIAPLLGTPYQPNFKGAILVLEDIGEEVYGIDRYLVQLKYAGVLKQIAGLVLGQFLDTVDPDKTSPDLTLEQVIREYTQDLRIPILANFPYGHNDTKYTMPIGCRVRLDASRKTLTMLEAGVIRGRS